MSPAVVVEPFQVLEDGTSRYLSVGKAASMHELGLQGGDETLCHCVVQGCSASENEGQIEEAFSRRYVGDVRQPDPVGLSGHEVFTV